MRDHEIIGKIGQQDADHDVQLAHGHQQSAPLGRRDLGDIHRADDGSRRPRRRRPASGKTAAHTSSTPRRSHGGNQEQHRQQRQHRPPAPPIRRPPGQQSANHRADQGAGDGEPEQVVVQAENRPQAPSCRKSRRCRSQTATSPGGHDGADHEDSPAAAADARGGRFRRECSLHIQGPSSASGGDSSYPPQASKHLCGQTTEAPPTATPPSQRKKISAYQFQASAQPSAAITNSTASTASTGRRPQRSAGRPMSSDPSIVPMSKLDTVKTQHEIRQAKRALDQVVGAGDHDRIKAKEEGAQRGHHGAEQQGAVRRWRSKDSMTGVSVATGACIIRARIDGQHRAAIVAGVVPDSNLLTKPGNRSPGRPPLRLLTPRLSPLALGPMEYVNLGSSGVKVSRLCLGCMTYGSRKWREWVLEEQESRPFIRQAIEAGINFFERQTCIRSASARRSLGAPSRSSARRATASCATKVFNAMGSDPNQRGLSRKQITTRDRRQPAPPAASITSTSTRSTASTTTTPIEETLEALNDVVRAGKARYIGASSM